MREELGETILLNETLGAPSAHAMEKLFAKIDAEPARKPAVSLNLGARIAEFFREPHAAHAGLVGERRRDRHPAAGRVDRQHRDQGDRARRLRDRIGAEHRPGVGAFTIIRFAPQASSDDITKFLEANKLQIAAGPMSGGLYKVRVAMTGLPKAELAASSRSCRKTRSSASSPRPSRLSEPHRRLRHARASERPALRSRPSRRWLLAAGGGADAQKMFSRGGSANIGVMRGGDSGYRGGGYRGGGYRNGWVGGCFGNNLPGIAPGVVQTFEGGDIDDRQSRAAAAAPGAAQSSGAPPANERRMVPDEVVIEIANSVSAAADRRAAAPAPSHPHRIADLSTVRHDVVPLAHSRPPLGGHGGARAGS